MDKEQKALNYVKECLGGKHSLKNTKLHILVACGEPLDTKICQNYCGDLEMAVDLKSSQ